MAMRALAWCLLVAGVAVGAFGLFRVDAANDCVRDLASVAHCEDATYWIIVSVAGAFAAFLGVALLVAPRRRSRIV